MTTGRSGSPRRSSKPALPRRRTLPNLEQMEQRALLAGLVVDQIGSDPGTDGTLAFALNLATSGQTVTFNIPGAGPHVISVPATLTVPDGVTVNGYSETGASANSSAVGNNAVLLIQLDGSAGSIGLIVGTNAVVRGLSFVNFTDAAVSLTGGGRISGSWVGVTTAGAGAGNVTGIRVAGAGNTIGGSAAADRNLISANTDEGIELTASAATPLITNNYIGTNAAGTAALANGVGIAVDATAGVTIGVAGAGNANVISANTTAQVALRTGSHSVVNNTIGLDATGAAAPTGLAGPNDGIVITAGSNVIGGGAGSANAIGANLGAGVSVSGATATGNRAIGNAFTLTGDAAVRIAAGATGNTIGGSTSNTIAAGATGGVVIQGAGTNSNLVVGNRLSGSAAVLIRSGAASNTVGGAGSALANSVGTGSIELTNAGTNQNLIIGNSIVAGAVGLRVAGGAASNTIGGTASDEENTISGATSAGIELTGTGTNANLVIGNIIGTSATGLRVAGGASSNTIGGGAAGAANEITGATAAGIELTGAGTSGNRVLGHDLTGLPIGIDLNNSVGGNTIGGTAAGEGNDLSAMTVAAIRFTTNASSNIAVANSLSGNAVGVVFDGSATGNTFGGANAADANTIGTSTAAHIRITQATSNRVRGNSLDSSSPVGVELLSSASSNIIGPGNTIAAGTTAAVRVAGLAGNPASGNRIIGNQLSGGPSTVVVEGTSSGNSIGGVGVGEGNTITGATTNGVFLTGAGVTANQVLGNAIDSNGVGVLIIAAATGNTIGSTIAGGANTIDSSGNAVRITGSGTDSNRVAGNRLESNGTYVLIDTSASSNTFGPGNSFLNTAAISLLVHLEGAGTDSNVVTGNTFPANSSDAVLLDDGASDNTIGGTSAAEGNTFSGAGGVTFAIRTAGASTGNVIAFNSISGYGTGVAIGASGVDTVVGGGNTITGNAVGISIGADDAVIGGATPNRIFGNSSRGVGVGAARALIDGNVIGLDLAGTGAGGAQAIGIRLSTGANNATIGSIFGNTISGNTAQGILLEGGSGGTVVQGNVIGLGLDGSSVPNSIGIELDSSLTTAPTIGGTTRNTISGNTNEGILVERFGSWIRGNVIGLNAAGLARGNSIGVRVVNAIGVSIGSSTQGENVISGNTIGVDLQGAVAPIIIEGNFIGTSVDGTAAVGNQIGVDVDASVTSPVTIGGLTSNFISGNTSVGIAIGSSGHFVRNNSIGIGTNGAAVGNATGIEVTNASDIVIGAAGVAQPNVISGNTVRGIALLGGSTTNVAVRANTIGLLGDGITAVGNPIGILVSGPDGVTIGGTQLLERNVISGNTTAGIRVEQPVSLVNGTTIIANRIGLRASGTTAPTGLGATGDGIVVASPSTRIGGAGGGEGNVFAHIPGAAIRLASANASTNLTLLANAIGLAGAGNGIGIWVETPTGGTIDGSLLPANTITGNTVGIRIDSNANAVVGMTLVDNQTGILVQGATGTTIGGSTVATRNTISRSSTAGISLQGASGLTSVVGNWIGLSNNGLTAASNAVGILVNSTNAYTLDGATVADRNTIAGNVVGVRLQSNGHSILGMPFGLNAVGTAIGNTTAIEIRGGANNRVGGSGANQGNTITGAAGSLEGVLIDAAATNNTIQSNLIADVATGIAIRGASTGNSIGGAIPPNGNTVSGATGSGIEISGAGTSANIASSNVVGTSRAGVSLASSASLNTIGSNPPGSFNILSGNSIGLEITGAATENLVAGNAVGLDSNRLTPLPNTVGVVIAGGSSNSIRANLISANLTHGVEILNGGSVSNVIASNFIGFNELGAAAGNGGHGILFRAGAAANSVSGNTIASSGGFGILFDQGGQGSIVSNNLIGLNVQELVARPNVLGGIGVDDTDFVTVGGAGAGNTIAGNDNNGILITSSEGVNISENLIGLSTIGGAFANTLAGVLVDLSASDVTIGGNTIAANGTWGVDIAGPTSGTVVAGNRIGTTADGLSALHNVSGGVRIRDGAFNNSVGLGGQGNLISGHAGNPGVLLSSVSGNTVTGNTIGLGAGGAALGNSIGVRIDGGSNNVVGSGNLIAGNADAGVEITGLLATGNTVTGNTVGALGAGNAFAGVRVVGDASLNSVASNTVGFSSSGVEIDDANDNSITGNAISTSTVGLLFENGATGNVARNANAITGNTIGVEFRGSSTANTVGGGSPNRISGNITTGVLIGSDANALIGNLIGLDAAGTGAQANLNGVVVDGFVSSVGNTISANTIAGNTQAGIRFRNAGTGATLVSGNVVGLTPAGLALANATGISIDSSVVVGLVIGDSTPNTISGNSVGARIEAPGQTLAGNWFGLDLTGTAARPNGRSVSLLAAGTTIGGATAATRNIFSGQLTSLGSTAGILIDDAASTGTTIVGNWFGLASDGLATVPNSIGIQVASTAPAGLVIGGAAPNTIGGNTDAGILVQRSGTTVETNLIGFDSAGNLEPNLDGIVISGAAGVTIGGATAGEANTIGGNTNAGVALRGAGTTNSAILGNRIGLGLTGAAAPNAVGVLVENSAGVGNLIGGTTPNTISGNTTAGVEVRGDAAIIAGNWIGIDLTGTAAIANGVGVLVDGAPDVEVGSVGAPVNVISGNTAQGVRVTGASDGTRLANNLIGVNPVQSPVDTTTAIPNAVGVEIDAAATGVVTVGHPSAPNSIAGNTTGQVVVRSSNHVVAGNIVGFARNGTSAPTGAAAGAFGVAVLGQGADIANAVVVGRTGAGEGNSIGFVNIGVRIEGQGATATSVAANRIGLALSGTAAAPVGTGVLVAGAGAGVTIGGSTAALRNIISGATGSGVELSGQAGALVAGNWVGLDASGEAPIANLVGVLVLGTSDANTISANTVSGNTDAGIELRGAGATRNAIAGNVVGLGATGADLGVGSNDDGVLLTGVALNSAASSNTIGGFTAADGNTISGNRGNGVLLTGGSAFTVIARNRIGLDLTGLAARGNDGDGVRVDQGSDNTIGALGAGNGNTISANAGWGVEILGAGSVRNTLFNNAIGLNTAGAGDLPNLLGPINITNGDNTIGTGNTINASGLDGIVFNGPAASNNLVEGVTIVNGLTAVVIRNGATGNTIGSGNDFRNNQLGVRIDNASANTVVGSTIASNALGGIVLENGAADNSIGGGNSISGNAGPGVEVRTGATDNTIGGATPNTISNNTGAGVLLTAGGNLVSGNSISGNTIVGVRVDDAAANTIGPDNSISNNLGDGVEVSGAASANTRVIGNLISGNLEAGLRITDGASATNVDGANTITGNFFQGVVIETDATLNTITGNSIASNGGDGVGIDSAPANVVGPSNTISANLGDGIEISGATSTGNRVFTNSISDNSGAGVRIGVAASGNTVDAANTISGNDLEGVVIETGATLNTISANSIAGNTRQGVLIQDAATTGNSISGNTISSNTGDGLAIVDAPANIVGLGNTISAGLARGLSIAGAAAIGNSVTGNSISGNSLDGVEILQNASANTITGNTIRSNVEHGVAITGSAFANRVASNSIGLNFGDGVLIDATADNVVASNTVTGNSGNGVRVSGAAAQRNLIQGGEVTVNSFDGIRIENSATANTISGVLVTGNGRAGVALASNGNLLTGGSVGGNLFEGVAVTGGSNTVTGATITSNTGVGVALVGPSASVNLITANSITGGASEGIFLFRAPGNSIGAAGLGNTVSGNVGDGIELVESNVNSLVDNVVFDNDSNGIVIRSSESNSLSGNISVGHETGDGLLITGHGSFFNLVVSFVTGLDTSISPNANRRGIAIIATPGTTVALNTIGGATSDQAVVVNDNLSTGIDLSGAGVIGTLIRTSRVLRNTGPGIMLSGATATTIGGGGVDTFNLVSGGAESGIILAMGTTFTRVVGNRIGTDLAGLLDEGNAVHGLVIAGATGSSVTGNLISGNGASGIALLGVGTAANRIVGNTIGLGLAGARLGNDGSGIRSNGGENNTIGGTRTGEPNYISGNAREGIYLSNDTQGNLVEGNRIGIGLDDATAVGNAIGVAIVGTAVAPSRSTSANVVRSNFIAGNSDQGIDVVGLHAISNTIASNDIGRTPTGTVIGNGSNLFTGNGVHIGDRASSNLFDSNRVVGSFGNGLLLDTGARANLLTGNISTANGVDGVQIFGNSSANPTQGNTLSGNTFSGNAANGLRLLRADAIRNDILANIIGLAADGTTPRGNAGRGVLVQDAVANTISNNTVGSNGASGIELIGATTNAILDNRVGLDAAGTVAANGGWGVTLLDASSNSFGGNTIAGNRDGGLLILGSAARGNLIGGNSIGLALDGAVLPAGSRGDAILIGSLAAENTVAGNLLSGHQGNGLRISTGATANLASSNRIGVDVAATSARPNQGSGVVVDESATANTIGAANTISGNRRHGVFLNAPGNTVRGNRIGLNAAGSAPIPNEEQGVIVQAANSTVGPNNTISGNRINNVFVNGTSASDSLIIGNILGLDAAGNTPIEVAPLGPAIVTDLNLAQNGIRVLETRGVVIRGNVVSGNGYAGILVQDDGAVASTAGATIVDNLIGLNAEGTASAARATLAQYNNPEIGGDGILILDSPNNVVRSNTISGNPNVGLWILGGGSSLNGVFSNVIGLDAEGLIPIPNHDGIVVRNAPNNTIGGPSPDPGVVRAPLGNTISGAPSVIRAQLSTAISVLTISNVAGQPGADPTIPGTPGFADGTIIEGNFIGPDALGRVIGSVEAPAGPDVGIYLNSVQFTRVHENLISSNGVLGVQLFNNATVFNLDDPTEIRGTRPTIANVLTANSIGTNFEGTAAVPNGQAVFINDASGNTIGGTSRALGNLISGNLNVGLQIMGNNIGNAPKGSPRGTPRNPINQVANNTVGLTRNRVSPLPNEYGIFVNGANNPIEGNNAIGSNRRAPFVNRPARSGPTVDLVNTVPGAGSLVDDSTPIQFVTVSFGQYIDPASAERIGNYRIQELRRRGASTGRSIAIESVSYDQVTRTATITLATPPPGGEVLTFGGLFRITVVGAPTRGIKGRGRPSYFLDGLSASKPGTNFTTQVQRGVELAAEPTTNTAGRRRAASLRIIDANPGRVVPKTLDPRAVDRLLADPKLGKPTRRPR